MSNLKKPPKPEQHAHPSYGMLSISRSMNTNATRLFGSSLKSHHGTIRLSVHPGYMQHELNHDWYHATTQTLFEIELSAAQFAEAITSLNSGQTPCTIRFNNGFIEDPPDIETEVERVKNRFGADLKDMIQVLRERRAEIEKLTSKLPDKAKRQLKIELDVMIQQLTSNVPYVLEQFDKATEKVVTSAKTEIENFTMHALRAAGLEAIAEGRLPKMLAASADVDKGPCPECVEYGSCSVHREKP
jgi:hypothetical protein